MTNRDELRESIAEMGRTFRSLQTSRSAVWLLHHNDADGITCGYILERLLERLAIPTYSYALEKPYPLVLSRVVDDVMPKTGATLMLADFGSGLANWLTERTPGGSEAVVIDHHGYTSAACSNHLKILNPTIFGLSGRTEFSTSILTYLLAEELSLADVELLLPALLGAIGDGQHDGALMTGENARILELAKGAGRIEVEGKSLYCSGRPRKRSLRELATALDHLGSVEYLNGGVDLAKRAITEQFPGVFFDKARAAEERYNRAYDAFLSSTEMNRVGRVEWFTLGGSFVGFGVKTVGFVCDRVIRENLVGQESYIMGIQEIPPDVPGLGRFDFDAVKVSFRIPPKLLLEVNVGRAPSLVDIVPPVAMELGGFVDAIHPHAAAVTVPTQNVAKFTARFATMCDDNSEVL